MKLLIGLTVLATFCAFSQASDGVCHSKVVSACSEPSAFSGVSDCNAVYGNVMQVQPEVQAYVNMQLNKSYEYLLLATHFNSYEMNRVGFQKLYQGLSDRSFDDSIDLIKQITRRGGVVDFKTRHEPLPTDRVSSNRVLEVYELHSMALALDIEKELADRASHVHTRASHVHEPEMAHYLEEKFLSKQAETVRKVSGYVNDLAKLMKVPDPSLSIYMFDEYLQKQ